MAALSGVAITISACGGGGSSPSAPSTPAADPGAVRAAAPPTRPGPSARTTGTRAVITAAQLTAAGALSLDIRGAVRPPPHGRPSPRPRSPRSRRTSACRRSRAPTAGTATASPSTDLPLSPGAPSRARRPLPPSRRARSPGETILIPAEALAMPAPHSRRGRGLAGSGRWPGGGRTTSARCSGARASRPSGAACPATARPAVSPTPTGRAASAACPRSSTTT